MCDGSTHPPLVVVGRAVGYEIRGKDKAVFIRAIVYFARMMS